MTAPAPSTNTLAVGWRSRTVHLTAVGADTVAVRVLARHRRGAVSFLTQARR